MREKKKRVTVFLAPETVERWTFLAGGVKKRAEYLAGIVNALYDANTRPDPASDLNEMRAQISGLTAELASVRNRVAYLEERLAVDHTTSANQ